MSAETLIFSYRVVENEEQKVFIQYLLPDVARLLRGGHEIILLGAVCGTAACGAAALIFPPPQPDYGFEREAQLMSLFVDPLVRRRGVGTGLILLAEACAREHGAEVLRANYVGEEDEVYALDELFRSLHAEPEYRLPVYEVDSSHYHDSSLLRRAFTWDYRKPDHIVTFSELDEARLSQLEQDPELPFYVDPARRLNMRPDLSLAYLDESGSITGFWLGSTSAVDRYSVQGVWHNSRAPFSCFHELLLAHLNLCYYRSGGDYLYYVSPAVEFADKLIRAYTGGDCRRLEEHSIEIDLDRIMDDTSERAE